MNDGVIQWSEIYLLNLESHSLCLLYEPTTLPTKLGIEYLEAHFTTNSWDGATWMLVYQLWAGNIWI